MTVQKTAAQGKSKPNSADAVLTLEHGAERIRIIEMSGGLVQFEGLLPDAVAKAAVREWFKSLR